MMGILHDIGKIGVPDEVIELLVRGYNIMKRFFPFCKQIMV